MSEFCHVSVLALTPGIFLVSAALQGASGFGMALLAVPLLTLAMEPKIAVPVTTMAGMVGSGMIVLRLWRHCDWRRAAWLGIPALVTAPFGVHLLKVLTTGQLCLGLGVILVVSAVVSLWAKMRARSPVAVEPLRSVRISPVGGSTVVLF